MTNKACNLIEFFNNKYKIQDCGYETPCWIWQYTKYASGYGQFKSEGKTFTAHVWRWQLDNGIKPIKHDLHHKCERRDCVNPDHLELLTRREHIKKSPKNIVTSNTQYLYTKNNGNSIAKKLIRTINKLAEINSHNREK